MFDLGLNEDQRLNYTELSATPALRRLLVFWMPIHFCVFVRALFRKGADIDAAGTAAVDVN